MPKIKRQDLAALTETQAIVAAVQVPDQSFIGIDVLQRCLDTAVINKTVTPERLSALPPPQERSGMRLRSARPTLAPPAVQAIMAELGTLERPLKLPHHAQSIQVGSSKEARSIRTLIDGQCSPSAVREAERLVGSLVMKSHITLVAVQILLLRAALPPDEASGAMAVRLFELLKEINVMALQRVIVDMPDGSASNTLAGHAARLFDTQALEIILAARGLNRASGTQQNDANACMTLGLLADVACQSTLWTNHPDRGVATIQCFVAAIHQIIEPSSLHQLVDFTDMIYGFAIRHRRMEMVPLIAEHAKVARAQVGLPEGTMLLWSVEAGWVEGAIEMLRLGVQPNDREPGTHWMHPTFCAGILPLTMAAQTPKIPQESDRIRLVQALLDAHAWPLAHHLQNSVGKGENRYGTAFEAAAKAGHLETARLLYQAECNARPSMQLPQRVEDIARRSKALGEKILLESLDQAASSDYAMVALALAREAHALILYSGELAHILQNFVSFSAPLLTNVGISNRPGFGFLDSVLAQIQSDSVQAEIRGNLRTWAQRAIILPETLQFDPISFLADPSTMTVTEMLDALQATYAFYQSSHDIHLLDYKGFLPGTVDLTKHMLRGDASLVEAIVRIKGCANRVDHALTFFLAAHASKQNPGTPQREERIAHLLVDQLTGAPMAAVLAEMALLLGRRDWLDTILEHVAKKGLDLSTQPGLMRRAVDAPLPLFKALLSQTRAEVRATWAQAIDEEGDTPLHLVARKGAKFLQATLDALPASLVTELCNVTNASGRTPAIEAITAGQVSAFSMLTARGTGETTGEVLVQALSARTGQVDARLMDAIASSERGAKWLRDQAGTLARKLARLGDTKALRVIAQRYKNEIFALKPRQSNLLHVAALADSEAMLDTLVGLATPGQLQDLASQIDTDGRLPEACSTDPLLAARFANLRGAKLEVRAASAGDQAYLRLRKLANKIAKPSNAQDLDRDLTAYLRAAEAREAALDENEALYQRCQTLGWEVVDHVARAQYGQRMGAHFDLHRPDCSQAFLRERAGTTLTGASRFAQTSAMALLRGRAQAIAAARAQIEAQPLLPGARIAVDVHSAGLDGEGYVHNGRGDIAPFKGSQLLRAIFAQDQNQLILVTLYPVAPKARTGVAPAVSLVPQARASTGSQLF